MVFASIVFLFAFLPLCLAVYYLAPVRGRNAALLTASLFFYAWGEGFFVCVLLASALANWAFGMRIESRREPGARRRELAFGVAINLSLLFTYKYAGFAFQTLGVQAIPLHLPIGISFFTFQAISYLVDVYRRDAPVERDPIRLSLYIASFPQLIAGPIVRYRDIAAQLRERVHSVAGFASGVQRFAMGLAKKVLIANTVAVPVDRIFALPQSELSVELAWVGIIGYTLQIYFDFSGYSDMAIGLGRMFGFRFLENFDYPYISRSVTEFWRRWHMSLSTWFRDYLYIPLGGNRGSAKTTYRNLIIVFLLCGLWHGANWVFLAWGALHGAFLVFERAGARRWIERMPRVLQHAYLLGVVMAAWVLFRSESLTQAIGYWGALLGAAPVSNPAHPLVAYASREFVAIVLIGVIGATRLPARLARQLRERESRPRAAFTAVAAMVILVVLSSAYLAAGTHNPFIYFRF